MNVSKLERLHIDDTTTFLKAAALAFDVANAEKLSLNLVVPKFRIDYGSAIGLCYTDKKEISLLIRYRSLKCNGAIWHKKPLSWNEINDTVLHEVAHLMYPDHGKQFINYESYLIRLYSIQ